MRWRWPLSLRQVTEVPGVTWSAAGVSASPITTTAVAARTGVVAWGQTAARATSTAASARAAIRPRLACDTIPPPGAPNPASDATL